MARTVAESTAAAEAITGQLVSRSLIYHDDRSINDYVRSSYGAIFCVKGKIEGGHIRIEEIDYEIEESGHIPPCDKRAMAWFRGRDPK